MEKHMVVWLRRQTRVLAVIGAIFLTIIAIWVLTNTGKHQPKLEKQDRVHYLWEDHFWLLDVEPTDLVRHRNIISSLRTGALLEDVGEFAVAGHKLVPGSGAVLVKQVFIEDPYPDQYVILKGGQEISQMKLSKLMIYLPDGIPDDGEVVEIGIEEDNGAFAMLTRGTLTNLHWSCYAYSDKGTVTAVKTKKIDGKVTVISIEEDIETRDVDIETVLSGHNIVLDIHAEFQMHNSISDGSIDCNLFSPVREGVLDRIWFGQRKIEDLPWDGNVTGPFDVQ